MMKILVCVKQVPDTSDIRWTENNTMQRDGVESILNPFDAYALDQALWFKSLKPNVEITVLTMGPLQAENVLRKAISLGCDRGVLLSDKKFAGADTYATGKTIAFAVKSYFSDFDLILCGQYAIDGDTAQTGPTIATHLNIPQVTFVKSLKNFDGKSVYALREIDNGYETVKLEFPSLICMLKGDFENSRPTINGIKKAKNTKIQVITSENLDLNEFGIKASPTYVSKAFRPENNRGKCIYCDSTFELSKKIKEYINE